VKQTGTFVLLIVSVVLLTACCRPQPTNPFVVTGPTSAVATPISVLPTSPLPTPTWTPIATPSPTSTGMPTPMSSATPRPTPVSLCTTCNWECWNEGHTVSCPFDSSLLLNQMTFVSDTEAWAVGNDGHIARWDGLVWTRIDSPTDKNLNAVTFLALDNGWIVGEGGQILHWDGNRWSVVRKFEEPLSISGSFLIWNAVGFSGPDDGWVVGYWSTEGGLSLDAMHWNGTIWEEPPTPPLFCESCALSDVVAFSPQDVWVVGESSGGLTLHWDGVRWYTVSNPFVSPDFGRCWFYSISVLSPDDIWVAGVWLGGREGLGHKGIVIHWNGAEWIDMQLPETGWVNSILMLSEGDGWVGGEESLHWNGYGWERATKPTVDRIVDMEKSPNGEIWALTEYGAFLHLEVSEQTGGSE
jgi:photosystem II stability/assembly factor-like uncharacterized protein